MLDAVVASVNENVSIVGSARYRESSDATLRSPLLASGFDSGNEGYVLDVGARFSF